jgi:RNA polymerase sigma-70 factor (ECF subfamily)
MPDARATSSKPRLVALSGGDGARLTDEALIAGLLAGDERVATELYRRLVHSVDHTLYRIFGRREQDHDDLVQAAFEQIVTTLSTRRFAGACSLKTWASTLATHVGLKALRARHRERKVVDKSWELDEASLPGPRDPERDIDVREDIERLRAVLTRINPRRAEVVFLRDVLGHDLAEISVMQGVSVSAAQSLLVRGRKDLMKGLSRTRSGQEGLG